MAAKKTKVKVNRAPVLTLWAAIVAERLGYDEDAALTLGKTVAGLNAQSKGRRLGIFEAPGEAITVNLLGRSVPAAKTRAGLRATAKGEPVDPDSVRRYLKQKFGDDLDEVRAAMEALAEAYPPDRLEGQAYTLYEKFRPKIPEGAQGWGARGDLSLAALRSMAEKAK